jgi:hypothetical protein
MNCGLRIEMFECVAGLRDLNDEKAQTVGRGFISDGSGTGAFGMPSRSKSGAVKR